MNDVTLRLRGLQLIPTKLKDEEKDEVKDNGHDRDSISDSEDDQQSNSQPESKFPSSMRKNTKLGRLAKYKSSLQISAFKITTLPTQC